MVPGAVAVAVKVTGARPATVAVREFAPTAPRVHDPTVAMPAAFVVCVAPVIAPPPEATANVTATPADGWPMPLSTRTDGATPTATPVAVDWPLPALMASEPIGFGMAVAANVAGVTPATVADSVLPPTEGPMIHEPTPATPAAFVVAVAPVILPAPPVIAKVTVTPETGLPAESRTVTDGATVTAVPTVALWLSPAVLVTLAGFPATTVTAPTADAPDEDLAVMLAVPMVSARNRPVLLTDTTDELSDENVMVCPVTGTPSSVVVTDSWTVVPTFSTADGGFSVTDTTPLGAVTESLPQRTNVNINAAASSTNRTGKDFIVDRGLETWSGTKTWAQEDSQPSRKKCFSVPGRREEQDTKKHLVKRRLWYGQSASCTTHELPPNRGGFSSLCLSPSSG